MNKSILRRKNPKKKKAAPIKMPAIIDFIIFKMVCYIQVDAAKPALL